MTAVSISAIICTYNREKFIGAALQSLVSQTLPAEIYEILVIDNNSSDHTQDICQQFIAAHPQYKIRYLVEMQRGVSFARNRAIREAQSDILAYMDDDAEADPHFLETILKFMQAHPEVVGAGGKIIPKYPETGEPRWMNRFLGGFVARQNHGEKMRKYNYFMKYPIGCNMTYRRHILEKTAGFNTSLMFRSEDKFINHEVKKISDNIWYLPGSVVYHNIDADRVSFERFRKLYLKTGNEEKQRVLAAGGRPAWLMKLVEFIAKFGVAVLIWLGFTLTGREIKGRYTMYSQWYTLKGFLQKEVFYR